MSDTEKPDTDVTKPAYQRAKVGQDDTGKVVTSAGDEPMSGTVADITDGEDHKHKKHK